MTISRASLRASSLSVVIFAMTFGHAMGQADCYLTLLGEIGGVSGRVRTDGHQAVIVQGGVGIQIIDFSNPTSPSIVATIPMASFIYDFDVSDGLLVTSMHNTNIVRVFDISDPSSVVEWPSYVAPPPVQGVLGVAAEAGLFALAAYPGNVVRLLAPLPSRPPTLIGAFQMPDALTPERVEIDNARMIVSSTSGDCLVSIEDPANPVLLSQLRLAVQCGFPVRASINGDSAVICQSKGDCLYVEFHDISDPFNPILRAKNGAAYYPIPSVAAFQDYFAVSYLWPNPFWTVDLLAPNPGSPSISLGMIIDENKNSFAIASSGTLLLTTSKSSGFRIYQTDPCYANCDCNASALDIDDFICFQTRFALADPDADCDADGELTVDDFVCFQTAYAVGC